MTKEALDYFKDRIRPILKTFGPHAIAMNLGTPAIHNTLGALAYVGLARALGTRNLYSVVSQDNGSKMVASRLVHGNEWIAPIMDLEQADFAVLFGTNPAVSQGTYMHLRGGTRAFWPFPIPLPKLSEGHRWASKAARAVFTRSSLFWNIRSKSLALMSICCQLEKG